MLSKKKANLIHVIERNCIYERNHYKYYDDIHWARKLYR